MNMTDHQKGILITAVGVLCIVPDSLFVRLISTDPLSNAFWRALIAGGLVGIWVFATQPQTPLHTLRHMGAIGWLYCAIIGSTAPAFVMAVTHTSVANVVFIFAAMPVFTAFFSWIFLKEPISRKTALTILAVMVGLSIIALGSAQHSEANWRGDLWALYITVSYGLAFTILRTLKNISMVPAVPIGFLGAALCLGFISAPLVGFSENAGLYVLHGVFIALGTSLMTLGPRYLSAPEVSLLILLESVLAPILVWVTLGEHPGYWAVFGGGIVIGALALSNAVAFKKTQTRHKKARSTNQ